MHWIKPLPKSQTEPKCGCVFSVMGYVLFICPRHKPKPKPRKPPTK